MVQAWWLALLAACATLYIAIFGQWEPAMETLSFVLVAAPVSCLLGLLFGVLCYKKRSVEAALMPLLNIAQTMPHFSYLVPVMVFFGVGDHAAVIITMVVAVPPMILLTLLGLRGIPPEVIEVALIQEWKVHITRLPFFQTLLHLCSMLLNFLSHLR